MNKLYAKQSIQFLFSRDFNDFCIYSLELFRITQIALPISKFKRTRTVIFFNFRNISRVTLAIIDIIKPIFSKVDKLYIFMTKDVTLTFLYSCISRVFTNLLMFLFPPFHGINSKPKTSCTNKFFSMLRCNKCKAP